MTSEPAPVVYLGVLGQEQEQEQLQQQGAAAAAAAATEAPSTDNSETPVSDMLTCNSHVKKELNQKNMHVSHDYHFTTNGLQNDQ